MPASRARARQQAGQRVGLDVDHDDVLAVFAAGQHVLDAGGRLAGRIDHDLDVGAGDDGIGVVGEIDLAVLERVGGALGVERGRRPATRVSAARAVLATGRLPLGAGRAFARRNHEHGTACGATARRAGFLVGFPLLEQAMQIHGNAPVQGMSPYRIDPNHDRWIASVRAGHRGWDQNVRADAHGDADIDFPGGGAPDVGRYADAQFRVQRIGRGAGQARAGTGEVEPMSSLPTCSARATTRGPWLERSCSSSALSDQVSLGDRGLE